MIASHFLKRNVIIYTNNERREKMKKKWKLISMFWIFGIIFNVCLVYTNKIEVKAEQLNLVDTIQVIGRTKAIERGPYLGTGSGTLTNKGNHVVNVSGYTSCNRISDEVKVTLYLQQLKNGVWQTVHMLGPKTAYSTNYVSNSKNYTVAGGYYYRVSGSHTAIKGKVVETTSSESDGLWISK